MPVQQPVLVLMGVSACGKSTVAAIVAGRLGWDFGEGDDLHPPANVAKMHRGVPLTDDDRAPWLRAVSQWITEHTDAGKPAVITCSALRRSYRDALRNEYVVFVLLDGTFDQIADRLAKRHGHYMPASLLQSQFDTLERPGPDERAIVVDITPSASEQAAQIIAELHLTSTGTGAAASTSTGTGAS